DSTENWRPIKHSQLSNSKIYIKELSPAKLVLKTAWKEEKYSYDLSCIPSETYYSTSTYFYSRELELVDKQPSPINPKNNSRKHL
ncbi:MAG: hypothetical protein IH946_08640, partial [Bacteroidetes bacterium]|nr:hypothetical protein [Bacteroidota bacterium]